MTELGGVNRARVILADDHIWVTDAIRKLLEPEYDVVGTFSDGQTLVEGSPELNPDIIVLDIDMPVMNGLRAGEHLKQILPVTKLVYLTMYKDPELAEEAFRIGASGYVLKAFAASELLYAIREAIGGRSYVTPMMSLPPDRF